MSWVSAIPLVGGLVDKALDRLLPDKKKVSEGQIELNKLELQDAPRSYLRLWRPFLFWVSIFIFRTCHCRICLWIFPNLCACCGWDLERAHE